ncbi:Tryptophan synthase alpha chain [Thioalkalivibrio nitratireducens DSM 14787]|uniref:Tryptophan synthase alpha chain n=1 Tax=Thioalkalivibrio nitratireducens (strain DSM 14787 / UNIQEM 213 / ALEN2) TaxID=1255043 RepID=L0DV96_THIND|nr:tryptophan synthase subunit alpha [Thioalkalivibrio nitratireducens]AGA32895.1 Tryptophan synthase alpha chain [Thioalkalivibrio nitratireducens DSM 14787]
MSRIAKRFADIRAAGRAALVPYITAGDPAPEVTVPLMHDLVAAGAEMLELGVPFSDPMADGPVIQLACERALAHGTSLRSVLEMVREFRQQDTRTPVILMGYLNPVERMGAEAFAAAAAAAGVDGVLVVDLPPEESGDLTAVLETAGIDPIFLVAPTTSGERVRHVAAAARGFIYYVSLKGVTGSQALDADALGARLDSIRGLTGLPLGVGFGIRDADTAAKVARVADAVVVGSALVRQVEQYPGDPDGFRAAAAATVREMRVAMDAARSANTPASSA